MITREFDLTIRVPQQDYIDTGIKLVQNDNVYIFNLRITDGITDIDYNQVDYATITFKKRDGNVVQGNLVPAGTGYTYKLGTNEISCPGKVLASIQLFGEDGERLTTARFRFEVVADLITPGAVQSESHFPLLQQLVADVEQLKQDIVNLQIPDGSIMDVKLSDATGQIKQRFASHMADSAPHPEANFATKDYVQGNTMFIFPYTSPIADANLDLTDGIYPVEATLKNGPYAEIDANNQGILIVLRWQMVPTYKIQIHASIYGSIYVRVRTPLEGWTPWRKAIDSSVLMFGNGSPEGVVTAPVGTLYRRTDGGASSTLYVKESGTGNTGWKAVQTI